MTARTAARWFGAGQASADARPSLALPGAQSPRSTPALARRLQWELRTRARLAVTDATIVMLAALLVAVGTVSASASLELVRPELVLATPALVTAVWLIALAGVHSRDAAILCAGPLEYRRVVHATALSFGVLAVPCLVLDWPAMRLQLLIALPLGLLALLIGRWQWRRWLLSRRREGELASRTILVGDRDEVAYVLDRLSHTRDLGYHVLGAAVSGDPGEALMLGDRRIPLLGSRESLAETAERLGADTVILASKPDADPDYLTRLSRQLEGTCAELVLFSRLTDVAGPRISFRPVDGLPLIQVRIPTFDGGKHVLKRALDVVVAGCALLAVAVVAVPIAIAIKLDSPGPVLFRQQRVGRDGRTFDMLKFRTMHVDAEQQLAALLAQNEGSGPLFKMHDDPRVTRVGRFLRAHSLDELPQFWNALVGDMSVVGPRPPLPGEATTYDGTAMRRLYLKPGITGLWQISGRSDLSWAESVRLDLRYVENWSVMQDLMIIFRTARVVVHPSGAY
ncbi:sugar transferase [Agrococcus baldri]|uniref:Polyprenyl glycosylphosphotransferase n=1 Tax=Agrococcus baldri TaxID=153730 RepID=A0AA87RIH7_9MICO|nr:sugar transferase [Agrococcus baldri]GEK78807.1 polyprenyl glycosylphosphotransferase [Agrococcus baldri]